MGSAASINPCEEVGEEDNFFKNCLSDKNKMDALFTDIASKGTPGRINSTSRINITNLLNYFNGKPDPLIKKVLKNKYVLLSAFKFATEQDSNSLITKPQFYRLMASIYLFSHLWDVISIVDKNHEIKRLSRFEFEKAKEVCCSMSFLHIGNITEEDWNQEFNRLDTDHDESISFYELCAYMCKNVVDIDTYLTVTPTSTTTIEEEPSEEVECEEDDKNHYISASASVAAWEAEQALIFAHEEEKREKEMEKAGLIYRDPFREAALRNAVEKTEQAAKMAAEAAASDNKENAWAATEIAIQASNIVNILTNSAVEV